MNAKTMSQVEIIMAVTHAILNNNEKMIIEEKVVEKNYADNK